jgi:hypothetical protein
LVLLRASPCTTETAMGTPSCIDRDRDIEKSVNVYIFERKSVSSVLNRSEGVIGSDEARPRAPATCLSSS